MRPKLTLKIKLALGMRCFRLCCFCVPRVPPYTLNCKLTKNIDFFSLRRLKRNHSYHAIRHGPRRSKMYFFLFRSPPTNLMMRKVLLKVLKRKLVIKQLLNLIRTSHSRTQRTTQMTKFARTTLSIHSPELPT